MKIRKNYLFVLTLMTVIIFTLLFSGCESADDNLHLSIYTAEGDNITFKEIDENEEYIVVHNYRIDQDGLNWELNFSYDGYVFIYMTDDNGQLFSGDSGIFKSGQYTKFNNNIKVSNYSVQNGSGHIAFSPFHFDSDGMIVYNDEPSYMYIYTYKKSPLENTEQIPTGIYGVRLVRKGVGYSNIALLYQRQQ